MRTLSPTAILGYGFPVASFQEGLRRNPHVIAVDAVSSDPGPYDLGAGVSFTDRSAVKRDLRAGIARRVPIIIGSAGGAVARAYLRLATIDSEIDKRTVEVALHEGRISSPVFIAQTDSIIDAVRDQVADNFTHLSPQDYKLIIRVYGRDGVLGPVEPIHDAAPHEVCIVIEAVAGTAALAKSICGFARSTVLHLGYPDRISTAGNLAFPYSPSDFDAGEVFEFSIYHLMQIESVHLLSTVIENIDEAKRTAKRVSG
ncbi:hypothetical protein [Mesorhizobium sp. M0998]|uniref:hypothetical protein n=1 Tax=Mesorhizobium sp. M0998 TaxID=2957044 RepID=UPI00333CF57F